MTDVLRVVNSMDVNINPSESNPKCIVSPTPAMSDASSTKFAAQDRPASALPPLISSLTGPTVMHTPPLSAPLNLSMQEVEFSLWIIGVPSPIVSRLFVEKIFGTMQRVAGLRYLRQVPDAPSPTNKKNIALKGNLRSIILSLPILERLCPEIISILVSTGSLDHDMPGLIL